jgi:hypothetical protein
VLRSPLGRARRIARYRALRGLFETFVTEKTPDVRAKRLLREWLSPEQRRQFEAEGRFEVTGGQTDKRYRIFSGSCANVYELDSMGEPVMGLCFVPAGSLAAGDVMLAQKIALETSEAEALARANRFPPWPLSMRPFRQRTERPVQAL